MKTWTTILMTIICLTWITKLQAQDGSDIIYLKINKLDNSFIGDFVHLDFYNESFISNIADTVIFSIDGQNSKFVEHRIDDGFNNWFNDQYLESIEEINGLKIRIVKFKLDSISKESLFLTSFLEYYDNNKLIAEKSRLIQSSFPKKVIRVVLISNTYHNERKK